MDKNDVQNIVDQAYSYLGEVLFVASDLFNSDFSIALVGAAAGALGGALAAQKIIETNKRREIFLNELRSTNAAIVVSSSICNAFLSLKKQHVLPFYEKFNHGVDVVHKFNERKELGELDGDEQCFTEADFRLFECPKVPIDTLKDLVFNKISEHGRPLAALAHLDGVLASLERVIAKREELVDQFKNHEDSNTFHYVYFGLTRPDGNTNQEYADVVDAIHRYTDDVIFFSNLLCNDLMSHGVELRSKNSKFTKRAPKVNCADFSGSEASGFMPPKEEYADWLCGFKKSE